MKKKSTSKVGTIVIKNACIVDLRGRVKGSCVVIKDGFIKKIETKPKSIPKNAKVIDAEGRVVMPGLINCHTHLYSSLSGFVNVDASCFMDVLERLWWQWDLMLDEEDVYLSSMYGLLLSLKAGVTTVYDHHASYNFIRGSLNTISKAFNKIGIRGCLCFEVSDRHGMGKREEALKENFDFLSRCYGASDASIKGMLGLHASFTLSDEAVAKASWISNELDVGVHVHLLEDECDRIESIKQFGMSPVDRFKRAGFINDKSIFAHGVHFENKEMNLFKKNNAMLVHNPYSNMNNNVGTMPYSKLSKMGIKVGVGTDGFGYDPGQDARFAATIDGKKSSKASDLIDRVFKSLMTENALKTSEMFGLNIGSIKVGAAADIVIRDVYPASDELDNGDILFRVLSAPVYTVISQGRVLLNKSKVQCINEKKFMDKIEDHLKKMKKKWAKSLH